MPHSREALSAGANRLHDAAFAVVRWAVFALAGIAGLAFVVMVAVTCTAVVLRAVLRWGLVESLLTWAGALGAAHDVSKWLQAGEVDIVKIAGGVAIACALPYTTAVKGHVAIEYFFHKLSRRGRIAVDTATRLAAMGLFGLLSWRCVRYGLDLRRSGEVTLTLEIPLFWIPHVMALCCATMVFVILYNLLHPGREFIKP